MLDMIEQGEKGEGMPSSQSMMDGSMSQTMDPMIQ